MLTFFDEIIEMSEFGETTHKMTEFLICRETTFHERWRQCLVIMCFIFWAIQIPGLWISEYVDIILGWGRWGGVDPY